MASKRCPECDCNFGRHLNTCSKARTLEHYTEQARIANLPVSGFGERSDESAIDLPNLPATFCIDCGQPTTPGKGSARCPSCWQDRCGTGDVTKDASFSDTPSDAPKPAKPLTGWQKQLGRTDVCPCHGMTNCQLWD